MPYIPIKPVEPGRRKLFERKFSVPYNVVCCAGGCKNCCGTSIEPIPIGEIGGRKVYKTWEKRYGINYSRKIGRNK